MKHFVAAVAAVSLLVGLTACADEKDYDPDNWRTWEDPATGHMLRCFVPNDLGQNSAMAACYTPTEAELATIVDWEATQEAINP